MTTADLPISRPAVSQHLKVLYRLEPDGIAAVRAYLDHMWSDALRSFAEYAESTESEEP